MIHNFGQEELVDSICLIVTTLKDISPIQVFGKTLYNIFSRLFWNLLLKEYKY